MLYIIYILSKCLIVRQLAKRYLCNSKIYLCNSLIFNTLQKMCIFFVKKVWKNLQIKKNVVPLQQKQETKCFAFHVLLSIAVRVCYHAKHTPSVWVTYNKHQSAQQTHAKRVAVMAVASFAVDRSLIYIWRTFGTRVKKFAVVPRGTNKPK